MLCWRLGNGERGGGEKGREVEKGGGWKGWTRRTRDARTILEREEFHSGLNLYIWARYGENYFLNFLSRKIVSK